MLGALAQAERAPLQVDARLGAVARRAATNSWRKLGIAARAVGPRSALSGSTGSVAPAEHPQALLGGEPLDLGDGRVGLRRASAGRNAVPTA